MCEEGIKEDYDKVQEIVKNLIWNDKELSNMTFTGLVSEDLAIILENILRRNIPIDIRKRLPDKSGGEYIVRHIQKNGDVLYDRATYIQLGDSTYEFLLFNLSVNYPIHVTHWQNLPQLPEVGKR